MEAEPSQEAEEEHYQFLDSFQVVDPFQEVPSLAVAFPVGGPFLVGVAFPVVVGVAFPVVVVAAEEEADLTCFFFQSDVLQKVQ